MSWLRVRELVRKEFIQLFSDSRPEGGRMILPRTPSTCMLGVMPANLRGGNGGLTHPSAAKELSPMNTLTVCLFFTGYVLAGDAPSPDSRKAAGWPDSAPLTKRNLVFALDGGFVRVDVLGERLFRIRHSKTKQWTESASNRYGILTAAFPEVAFEQTEADGVHTLVTKQAKLTISRKDGAITLADGRRKAADPAGRPGLPSQRRLRPSFHADQGRTSLRAGRRQPREHHAPRRRLRVLGPQRESLHSDSRGVEQPGMGPADEHHLAEHDRRRQERSGPDDLHRARSDLDYYLFCGPDYRSLLDTYTSLSGRPALLPIWGYALHLRLQPEHRRVQHDERGAHLPPRAACPAT